MLNSNKPPKITGLFNVISTTVGYLQKNNKLVEYTLDNPLVEKFQSVYDQKNMYITTYDLPHSPDSKISYGLWKKKLNQKLEFVGWENIYVTPDKDNTIYILEPTKVKHNKVIAFTLSLFNSGFNNNPPNTSQTSYVCQYTGTKAKHSNKSKK